MPMIKVAVQGLGFVGSAVAIALSSVKKDGVPHFQVSGVEKDNPEGREMVRVALAEFPDIETAKNCYNSEEYVEARKHLENNIIREHVIFEGM